MKTSNIVSKPESSMTQQIISGLMQAVTSNYLSSTEQPLSVLGALAILPTKDETWCLADKAHVSYWAKRAPSEVKKSISLLNSNLPMTIEDCLEQAAALIHLLMFMEKASPVELNYMVQLINILTHAKPMGEVPLDTYCDIEGCTCKATWEFASTGIETYRLCTKHARQFYGVKPKAEELRGG